MVKTDRSVTPFTRRRFVTGVGAALAAVPGLAHAVQFDAATPPPPPLVAPAPPAGESVAEVAARLNFDGAAIFAFVRDNIHYESYPGVLRGATGTLWSRAGNAADQAVLLGELLDAAQIPWRFAIGPLEPAAAGTLTALLTLTTTEAAAAYVEATVAASLHAAGVDDVAELPAAEGEAALDRFRESGQAAMDLAQASFDGSSAVVAGALDAAGISLPPLEEPRLVDREVSAHAWIQVADGPDWLDYDPSLPGDSPDPAAPVETPAILPEDWYHRVRITIAADDFMAGSLLRREVVTFEDTSEHLANTPIAVSMAAPDDLVNLGSTLTELFSGQKSIFPSIYAGGVTVDATEPLTFAVGGSVADPFGDGSTAGAADGETVATWLVVEITGPDLPPVTIERALLDRVPPEDRASGVVAPETIAPVTLVTNALGEETLEQFTVLPVIHTDVARMPAVDAVARFTKDTVFGGLGLLGPTLAGFRDALGLKEEGQHGYWSYPSAPNLTVFHVSLPAESDGAGLARLSVDLLHRHRTSLPLADVEPAAAMHPLVLSGILDAVAEQALLAPETRGETASDATGLAVNPSIGELFAATESAGVGLRVLTSTADLAGIEADAASLAYLTAALDLELYVVIPERPVDVAGEPLLAWWIVDPASGRTRDQFQNGMSYASTAMPARHLAAFQELGEYSFLTRAVMWVVANSARLACIAYGLTAVMFAANAYIAAGSAGASGAEVGASVGGVIGAAGAASGVC